MCGQIATATWLFYQFLEREKQARTARLCYGELEGRWHLPGVRNPRRKTQ